MIRQQQPIPNNQQMWMFQWHSKRVVINDSIPVGPWISQYMRFIAAIARWIYQDSIHLEAKKARLRWLMLQIHHYGCWIDPPLGISLTKQLLFFDRLAGHVRHVQDSFCLKFFKEQDVHQASNLEGPMLAEPWSTLKGHWSWYQGLSWLLLYRLGSVL